MQKKLTRSEDKCKNILPEYRNEIHHWKLCMLLIKKWVNRDNGNYWTVKSGMHQNAWREGKLQVLENIRSGHCQISRD